MLPTPPRTSLRGAYGEFLRDSFNMEVMRGCAGPMTRNMTDLVYLYQLYYSDEYYNIERDLPRITFDKGKMNRNKTYKIGVVSNVDEIVGTSLPIKRAIESAAQILEMEGHQVVDVEIPEIQEQSDNQLDLVGKTSFCSFYAKWWETANLLPSKMFAMIVIYGTPRIIIKGLAYVLTFFKMRRQAAVLKAMTQSNIKELRHSVSERLRHLNLVEKLWKEKELDAILMPTHPLPAFPCKLADDIGLLPCSARLAIYWQFCAGVLPITCVKEDEQIYEERFHNDFFTGVSEQVLRGAQGLPV